MLTANMACTYPRGTLPMFDISSTFNNQPLNYIHSISLVLGRCCMGCLTSLLWPTRLFGFACFTASRRHHTSHRLSGISTPTPRLVMEPVK